MGKKTLYHPVGLYVLRGAAELMGFDLGDIRQIQFDPESQTAFYTVQLRKIPYTLRKKHPKAVKDAFNECFSTDVMVHSISYTEAGGYVVQIATNTGGTVDIGGGG